MSVKALEILEHRVDLRNPYEAPVWIEAPFVARQAVTLFAGREGEGKSMVMQDAAIRYARDGYKVLLLDVENGARLIAERLQKLGLDPIAESDVISRISVFAPDSFDLASKGDDFMALQEMIMVAEPDVMIIDSLRSAYSQSLASPKVKSILELLRQLAQRANMGVVLLHHTTKSGNTYLGSGAIGGTVEMVYFMLRHKDDPDPQRRVITCYKQRLCKEPDDVWIQIATEVDGNVIQIEPAEPFVENAIGAHNLLTSRIMLALLNQEQDTPDSPHLTLAEICKKCGKPDKDRTVRRVLVALAELGHVLKGKSADSTTANPRYVYRVATMDVDTVLASMNEQAS